MKQVFYPILIRAFVNDNIDDGIIQSLLKESKIFCKKELYFIVASYINSKYAMESVESNKTNSLKEIKDNVFKVIKNQNFVKMLKMIQK